MLQIEFPSSESPYSFNTAIEGATYQFNLRWMSRTESWYMSIYDSKLNLIVPNLKLVPNFPLLLQKISIDFDGDLLVTPVTTTTTEITEDNLSSSWNLIYLSEDDISGE